MLTTHPREPQRLLKATCHPDDVLTPTARLAAMEDRLNGVLEAVNAVQAPLENFYQSLDDEQKARFNRLDDDQPRAFDDLDLHPTPLSRKLHPSSSIFAGANQKLSDCAKLKDVVRINSQQRKRDYDFLVQQQMP